MPRGQLSKEKRLEQLVTRSKHINESLRIENAELKRTIQDQNRRIKLLEEKVSDKEAQRKQLLSYLYKPNKERETAKPRGKKPGTPGYQRPKPKEDEVTEAHVFTMPKCPSCRVTPLGNPTETVIKYEEDIDLAPSTTSSSQTEKSQRSSKKQKLSLAKTAKPLQNSSKKPT